ncbi:MAG: hypothetical protein ACREXX_04010 [Gammaproteobacteria bacterium]
MPAREPPDDADTKVKNAVAHLERNRFLVREENRARVFSTSLRVSCRSFQGGP